MKTPICDFAKNYAEKNPVRVHMPGHKGVNLLGFENIDLTEMEGADDLYHPEGIISESENNTSQLFGCKTVYSTEGSSQCIRAMLYLAALYAGEKGEKLRVLAGRNAHKTFLSACALLDFSLEWLVPENMSSYLCAVISKEEIKELFGKSTLLPHVLYLTDPDYLGNKVDIKGISEVCKEFGVLLMIDNAHGAYLKFLENSEHPIDLGADICCDSAHKTLPSLTGGAYIHINDNAPEVFKREVKCALGMFGSTSPSYLILQSLDKVNEYISCGYKEKLSAFIIKLSKLKSDLIEAGFCFKGDEKIKFTFDAKKYGYTGDELAEILLEKNLVTEFHDPDFLVMMFTPETSDEDLNIIKNALLSIKKREEIKKAPPLFTLSEKKLSVREALFKTRENIAVEEASGRISATLSVACPPAIPIVVSGEIIDEKAIECLKYYGVEKIEVIKG